MTLKTTLETPEMDACLSAAEFIGIESDRMAAAIIHFSGHMMRSTGIGIISGIKQDSIIPIENYLVWSNEHNAWWGPNHRGYVNRVEHAGRYSKEEALKICQGANYSWNIERQMPNELPIAESAAMRMGVQREYRASDKP